MKSNIDFYQHYANADKHPKFKMLRVQYGWAGEGKFWALNNRIAQAENCCLDISKKYNKAAIASDLDFSLKEFDQFISYLLNECELVNKYGDGAITTDIIQENYNRVNSDRAKARERATRRWEKPIVSSPEIVKFSGEKVCKGKETKGKEKQFERFWILYGKKNDKKKCSTKFLALKQADIDLIFMSLPQYIASTPDKKYRKNPLSYLNGEVWNDEINNTYDVKKGKIQWDKIAL